MKREHIIIPFLVASVLLWSCVPDHRDDNMPSSAVYFVDNASNNGVQTVVMYDIQTTVESPVYVYCSGLDGGTPEVSAHISEDYIEYYNSVNGTALKPLPSDCYALTDGVATVADRKASFNLSFDVNKIKELYSQADFNPAESVVALRLDADGMDIALNDTSSLGYYLARPDLRQAVVQISGTVPDNGSMTLTVQLPFDNQWDFEFEPDYDIEGTFGLDTRRGNSIAAKYSCSKAPADFIEQITVEGGEFRFSPGTNSKEYTFVLPADYQPTYEKDRTNNFAMTIKNAKLTVDGVQQEIPVEGTVLLASYATEHFSTYVKTANNYNNQAFKDEQLTYFKKTLEPCSLEPYSDHNTFVWNPESSNDTYLDRPFNGNGYGWLARWSGGFGPSNQVPLWILVDMKDVRGINGIEWWRRGDGNVGDTKRIEVYALDDCTYTWKESDLTYEPDAITYLGVLDFGERENAYTVGATTLDYINTRYILLNLVESTRGQALDCAECVLWY